MCIKRYIIAVEKDKFIFIFYIQTTIFNNIYFEVLLNEILYYYIMYYNYINFKFLLKINFFENKASHEKLYFTFLINFSVIYFLIDLVYLYI